MATLANLIINDNGYMTIPGGTTAQRPTSSLTAGMARYNSSLNVTEYYNGSAWLNLENNTPTVVAPGNLVLHLDAGDSSSYPGSGTSVVDLSGNSNTGTLVNGVGYSANVLPLSGSFSFDGVNDYGTVTNAASLRPSTELTVSMWVKATTFKDGWSRLFGQDPYQDNGYLIFLETGGQQIRALHYPNGVEVRCNTSDVLSTTDFKHIVFTFKMGDAIRSYFNGVASTTAALSAGTFSYGTSSPWYFGYAGASYPNIRIANIQIWNKQLSQIEIYNVFNAYRERFGL